MVLKYKLKGAFWTPDPQDYFASIANAQPPAWHKDLSNIVSIRAAVDCMLNGTDPESYIKACKDPYDFMCRIKVKRSDNLLLNNVPIQKTSRYYVSTDGGELVKVAPPTGIAGAFKKKNGVSDDEYYKVMTETRGEWDARVCTGNKSKYTQRDTKIEAGYKITICNNVEDFSFDNVDYNWYITEARKLII